MGCLFLQRSLAQFKFDLRAMFRVGSESWSTAHCNCSCKHSLNVLTSALCPDSVQHLGWPRLVRKLNTRGEKDGIKSYEKWRKNLVPPNALGDLRQIIWTFASPSIPPRPKQPWRGAGDCSVETPPYRCSLCCAFDLYLISRACLIFIFSQSWILLNHNSYAKYGMIKFNCNAD